MNEAIYLTQEYFRPSSGYSLMPFRFERLTDELVFISSLAGEYVLLPSHEFENFVQGKLNPISETYQNLLARQILKDDSGDWGHELLSSKLFTKKSFLDGFTKLHIFVTTLRCNQSCPYCQVSRQGECADAGSFDMSEEVLERSIKLMLASPSDNITMEFQGGEPLLRFDILQNAVKQTKELNKRIGKHIDYVLCSNLLLLEDKHLDWCLSEGIIISTSLDGPKNLHDRNRPFGIGKSSHEVVTRNIRRAQEALGMEAVSALMTTTRTSLGYAREIVDEYLRMDMGSIFVRELNPYGFAIKSAAGIASSSTEFFVFYKKIFEYIIEINRQGRTFSEAFATMILTKAQTPWPINFVDLQSPAGAGFGVCLYNHDGEVYVSDEARMLAEAGDPAFRIGNVIENSYDEIFFGEAMQTISVASCSESLAGCSDCAFQPYCGADPVRNYRTQGDPYGNRADPRSFCHRNKPIIEYLMHSLAKADDDLKRIFWAWIRRESVERLKLTR
ncbi:MAG: His-Xaa-Ser system radical SAM maturase HxsB [Azoarcus sp.]|jgi:His-Xaa-Ser system radical SAM maturase HxsB|nr:His-Xaa-Ser system radical SAM maturase HxsB [Azoarcus sp.]